MASVEEARDHTAVSAGDKETHQRHIWEFSDSRVNINAKSVSTMILDNKLNILMKLCLKTALEDENHQY